MLPARLLKSRGIHRQYRLLLGPLTRHQILRHLWLSIVSQAAVVLVGFARAVAAAPGRILFQALHILDQLLLAV